MAKFETAIPIIKKTEGGLSKDPNDNAAKFPVPDGSGFHTNKGITWQTFTSLAPTLGYIATPKLFYEMPEALWRTIYKRAYWDAVRGDEIKSIGIAIYLVDFAFNSGPGNAVRVLQRVLNESFGNKLVVDGAIGPLTIAATNAANERNLLSAYHQARLNFINASSKIKPTLKKGLENRAIAVRDFSIPHTTVTVVSASLVFFLELWPL